MTEAREALERDGWRVTAPRPWRDLDTDSDLADLAVWIERDGRWSPLTAR